MQFFERSRSKWWQLIAGPLVAAALAAFTMWDVKTSKDYFIIVVSAAITGFVAALMLMVRDARKARRRRVGIASLTPSGFTEGAALSSPSAARRAFDEAAVLEELRRTVGPPPRRGTAVASLYRTPPRPDWLTRRDEVSRIYDGYRDIIDRGHVRWAAVVHANNLLFAPGPGDSGAQVVYAEDDDAPLARVRAWASACYAVKHTTPDDPAVRRIADMLTDELERALDWPVPAGLCGGGRAITTVVELPRELLPLGFLTCPYFPVFADPETKMAVVVPSGWWPAPLVNLWMAEGRARLELAR